MTPRTALTSTGQPAARPGRSPVVERLQGVVLVADLAGFTTLTAAMTAAGDEGVEALHTLLRDCFDLLEEHIEAAGGRVVTFAGDSLAALFAAGRRPDPGGDALADRVRSCAESMQAAIASTTGLARPGIPPPLLRVGLGAGAIVRALLGPPEDPRLVLSGPALTAALAAQAAAAPGGVETAWVAPRSDAAGGDASTGPWPPPPPRAPARADGPAGPARPIDVDPLAEHRTVTTLFAVLPGHEPPWEDYALLHEQVGVAAPLVRRHGGRLRQADRGPGGYQLVIDVGALRSGPEDAEHAVACALDLSAALGCAVGVGTGPAFCAAFGADGRREVAVVGDAVNVAARLAAGADPGQIRVDAPTAHRCAPFARLTPLGAVPVKGRDPVETHVVTGLRTDPGGPGGPDGPYGPDGPDEAVEPIRARAAPFVGRDGELRALREVVRGVRSGRGRLVVVTGEPGIGKTRLVREALAGVAVGPHAPRIWWGAPGPPGDRRPYGAWAPLWRQLGGTEEPAPGGEGGEVSARFAQARAQASAAWWTRRLAEAAARRPLVVVLDDAHRLDDGSVDLACGLGALAGTLPLALVVVGRRGGRGTAWRRLGSVPGVLALPVPPLSGSQAQEIVDGLVPARPRAWPVLPRSPVLDLVAERSGGNPLFVEQLVAWARESPPELPADVDPAAALPPDVRRLVRARVDRLVPSSQATLQAAAVVGDEIGAADVAACRGALRRGPAAEEDGDPAEDLRRLERVGLLRATDELATVFTFGDPLVREVVYATISGAARAVMHEAMGRRLEAAVGADGRGLVDALARHFSSSGDVAGKRRWLAAAADAAEASGAAAAAASYLGRLVPLLDGVERADHLVRLATMLQVGGRWGPAEAHLREALDLVGDAAEGAAGRARAAAERELGIVLLATTRRAEGRSWLAGAADRHAALGDDRGAARAIDRLAFALFEHGDLDAAGRMAHRQLDLARGLPDDALTAAALENLALVDWASGRARPALTRMRQAHDLARACGDGRLIVHTANDLAALEHARGDHAAAAASVLEAIETARRIGYRQALAYLCGNVGELYRDHGDLERARGYIVLGLHEASAIGDRTTMARCLGALAMTAADENRPGHRDLLARAAAVADRLERSYVLVDLLVRAAEAALDDGDLAAALDLARRAESRSTHGGDGIGLPPRLLRLHVEALADPRRVGRAVAELRAALSAGLDPPQAACVEASLALLQPDRADLADAAARACERVYGRGPSRAIARAHRLVTGDPSGLPTPAPLPVELAGPATHVDLDAVFDWAATLPGLAHEPRRSTQ